MPNRLAAETSPYLLQHADNPVDWYPWAGEALARARELERPILLSIGYSACHWCHVMAHESFEDPETAELMNAAFVNVKVDREERPDLDEIYMTATQIQRHHGGWPMTVFLTPDLEPFFCGTYFPPEPRHGMPGFREILGHVATIWAEARDEVGRAAAELRGAIERFSTLPTVEGDLGPSLLDEAAGALIRSVDRTDGGFGGAPKFPQPMAHLFLLRHWKRTGNADSRDVVELTLDRMARGGIYDHLGGGFARYSTDERWLVPHFEKMLYDNALLARLYLEAYQATGRADFLTVATETLDYVARDMTSPAGGFYSAEDADSEGVEGKFYVWTPEKIEAALEDPLTARIVARWFAVVPGGNFEGSSILTRSLDLRQCAALVGVAPEAVEAAVATGRRRLLEIRSRRVRPARDEKVLSGWTALTATAFALAHRVTGRADHRERAEAALRFIEDEMTPGGRLQRTWRDGRARIDAFQEDHAFLLEAQVATYEATFDGRWIERARATAEAMIDRFADGDGGGFYFTEADQADVLVRSKSPYESAIPSGNAAAAVGLLRLARLTGQERYASVAEGTIRALRAGLERSPSGFPYLLCALDLLLAPPAEVVLAGPDRASLEPFLRLLAPRFEPTRLLAGAIGDGAADLPVLEGKGPIDGRAAAFVCRDRVCRHPVTDAPGLAAALEGDAR